MLLVRHKFTTRAKQRIKI